MSGIFLHCHSGDQREAGIRFWSRSARQNDGEKERSAMQLTGRLGWPYIDARGSDGIECVYLSNRGIMKPFWLWDCDLDEKEFEAILSGRVQKGRFNQDWAAARLLDYAPYPDILRLLGAKAIKEKWPIWRGRVRSASRRRGLDFLAGYLAKHPEKLHG